MKRIFFICLIFFIIILIFELTSCNRCGPFDIHDFKVSKYKSYLVKNQTDSFLLNDTVIITDFKIAISVDSLLFVKNNKLQPGFSFLNSSYACSPALSESVNFISNIEIFSDKNLTSAILSNQNLKDYFIIKFHSLNSVNSFLLSNEFEKKFNEVYKIFF